MKIKKDQITGLVLIIVGLVFAYMTFQFKKPMTPEYPGPMLFPLIAVFGFVVCGLGIFLTSTFSKKEEQVFLMKEGWIKVIVTFIILCVYVFLMKYFGYLVVTPFVLFALSTIFAKGDGKEAKLVSRIVFSILFSILVYLLYVHVFSLTLPSGIFFD